MKEKKEDKEKVRKLKKKELNLKPFQEMEYFERNSNKENKRKRNHVWLWIYSH
jgi:hypothetical protein